MNIILIIPNVVRRYVASFPEATNNAYKYFNYDNRVVNERVQRCDARSNYKSPDDFTDTDYDALVSYAQQIVDAGLVKYSAKVACEDALHRAIHCFGNGMFDGKVNASRYNVLLGALMGKFGQALSDTENYRHAAGKEDKDVKPHVLKQLGIKQKDIPHMHKLRQRVRDGLPYLVREKGKVKLKKD